MMMGGGGESMPLKARNYGGFKSLGELLFFFFICTMNLSSILFCKTLSSFSNLPLTWFCRNSWLTLLNNGASSSFLFLVSALLFYGPTTVFPWPWHLNISFFSRSAPVWLLCLESLSRLMTEFGPRFRRPTYGSLGPRSCWCKIRPNH